MLSIVVEHHLQDVEQRNRAKGSVSTRERPFLLGQSPNKVNDLSASDDPLIKGVFQVELT
jgi:hypothetical protein